MMATFGRFLPPPPRKKPKKTRQNKTTEKSHQTKNPADTPALRGAAFFQSGAEFSRALPAPGRAGNAVPGPWQPPGGSDRVSMAAAAAEAAPAPPSRCRAGEEAVPRP